MRKISLSLMLLFSVAFANNWIVSNKSIIDTKHHLQWADTEKLKDNNIIWRQANARCQSLHLENFNDWRLPSVDELVSLSTTKDEKKLFTNLNTQVFWSDKSDNYDLNAFTVYIGNGHISSNDKCDENYAICVRNR